MNTPTILVVKGHSAYNVLRLAADEIIQGFNEQGYGVDIFDTTEYSNGNESLDILISLILDPKYCMIFSIQSLISSIKLFGLSICDYTTTPVVGYIVDDLIYHTHRLIPTYDNFHLAVTDKQRRYTAIKYFKNIINSHVLYHGGFINPNPHTPLKEREIDVFVASSYVNIDAISDDINSLPPNLVTLCTTIINRFMDNPTSNLTVLLEDYFEEVNLTLTQNEFIQLSSTVMDKIDSYIRQFYRMTCINLLIESGLKLTVCGSGWDNYQGKNKENIKVISETGIDITETIKLMSNSKFVLNVTPTIHGSHERIYSSMLSGAIAVTNVIDDMQDEFINDRDYIAYELLDVQALPGRLLYLLDNLKVAQEIADNGFEKAQHHRWQDRAYDILKMANLPTNLKEAHNE